jgi:hypothetical protein
VKNDNKMTYRQSQRLFIENFLRRLLVHHEKEVFSCPAHPSMQLLAKCVRRAIGSDGGSIAKATKHGCMDCTHRKRYRADLINEGTILGGTVDGVAAEGTDDQHGETQVRILFFNLSTLHGPETHHRMYHKQWRERYRRNFCSNLHNKKRHPKELLAGMSVSVLWMERL